MHKENPQAQHTTDNGNAILGIVSHRFYPSFATKEFPWKANSDDCFSCEIGDYYLRVEQMDKEHWWWRVYYKGEAIPELTNEYSNSKYRAIGYCEGLYMGHSIKNVC